MPLKRFMLLTIAWGLIFLQTVAAQSPASSVRALRILVPQRAFGQTWDQEFQRILEEFKTAHPRTSVVLIRKGKEFSSLPDFVAAGYVDEAPDLFLMEASEILAAKKAGNIRVEKPWMGARMTLYVDQEALFRHHLEPFQLPDTWDGLMLMVSRLSGPIPRPLGIPLFSSRGTWILESLASPSRWWSRLEGGVAFNRSLIPWLAKLRQHSRTRLSLDEGIEAFLSRKQPLLLASSDLEPYLKTRAEFRFASQPWKHGPWLAQCWAASQGNPTRKHPLTSEFLKWAYLPRTTRSLAEKTGMHPIPKGSPVLPSDPEILNLTSEWSRSLREFFPVQISASVSPALPQSDESIFVELENRLQGSGH